MCGVVSKNPSKMNYELKFTKKVLANVTTKPDNWPWLINTETEYLQVFVEGQWHRIERILVHPQYDRRNIDNDIALIILASDGYNANQLMPICLPSYYGHIKHNEKCVVVGWGRYRESMEYPQRYHQVILPIKSMDICNNRQFYDGELNSKSNICAGYISNAKSEPGICNGDSGVFTNVRTYLPWINQIVLSLGPQWQAVMPVQRIYPKFIQHQRRNVPQKRRYHRRRKMPYKKRQPHRKKVANREKIHHKRRTHKKNRRKKIKKHH
ncbi:hypothetical protein WR25_00102 [Diploscapter pachys]|uniref:Peptidase S1 domain-containing protein n=1 Tax=Diploscapter pachys TaxID=2018661 RepID=A0A2A2J9C0_9BILA|nr:hypothetical protein WR25_00102 [Diploscapter pachys]